MGESEGPSLEEWLGSKLGADEDVTDGGAVGLTEPTTAEGASVPICVGMSLGRSVDTLVGAGVGTAIVGS